MPELPFYADRDDVVALRALLEAAEGGKRAHPLTTEQLRRAVRIIDHVDRLTPKC